MSVCTLSDIKDRLGIQTINTEYDDMLNRTIAGLVAVFNNHTNRKLILNSSDETYCFTGDDRKRVVLPRTPVVSITSIKESWDYDFDNATALTANTDYRLNSELGVIYRIASTWCNTEDGVQVIYKGGYTAAGETPGDGETALPDDIREAAIMQASFIFKRRLDIGLSGQSFDGGSINKFAPMDLLPMVKNILNSYRRITL